MNEDTIEVERLDIVLIRKCTVESNGLILVAGVFNITSLDNNWIAWTLGDRNSYPASLIGYVASLERQIRN
jgi:hypothetical protein